MTLILAIALLVWSFVAILAAVKGILVLYEGLIWYFAGRFHS